VTDGQRACVARLARGLRDGAKDALDHDGDAREVGQRQDDLERRLAG
jgi:hypothetical protein